MITAWFNERGYKVKTSKGESRFVYDLPSSITENASALYAARWMVLNQLLDILDSIRDANEDRDILLCTDSRIIEELQGEVTPDGSYAQSSLRYFIQKDFLKFRRVAFQKHPSTVIDAKLGEPINQI